MEGRNNRRKKYTLNSVVAAVAYDAIEREELPCSQATNSSKLIKKGSVNQPKP